jgi:RNA polymerase-binding transcription factor DksA
MTTMSEDRLQTLRSALQAQFESHVEELTRLSRHAADPAIDGVDPYTVTVLLDSTRQSLADTTEALKRMTDGTYGVCQACRRTIPVERLEILPHAGFCVPCQQSRRG